MGQLRTQFRPESGIIGPSKETSVGIEESSTIDVCLQNSNSPKAVRLYIRPTFEDISELLWGAEKIRSRDFEGVDVLTLKSRIQEALKPLEPMDETEYGDGVFRFSYNHQYEETIYDTVERI